MTAKPIRLLISDIDGTLVRRDKTLSPETLAAVQSLTDSGIAMSLISARPISGILPLAEQLGLTGPFGAFNGGTLCDLNGVIGAPARLAPDAALTLLNLLDKARVDVWLFSHGQWHARNADNPHTPREILSTCVQPTLTQDLASLCDAADKIVGVSDDAPLLKQLEANAIAATTGRATVALSQPYFLDATALTANKGDGVAAIARAMNIPLDQTAVIGDMPNDLPMFARAALSIAMAQAPAPVLTAAHWTTASNQDNGVAQAIDRLMTRD